MAKKNSTKNSTIKNPFKHTTDLSYYYYLLPCTNKLIASCLTVTPYKPRLRNNIQNEQE